jgi:hypothetical protein
MTNSTTAKGWSKKFNFRELGESPEQVLARIDELTLIIKSVCPLQVPSCFKILQLPKEIISFLTALLRKSPVKEQLREEQTRSNLGCGEDGRNMPVQLALKITSTSRTSHEKNTTSSLTPLPWLLGMQDFQDHLMNSWLQTQSKISSSMYVQPSRKMDTQTQLLTKNGRSAFIL